MPRAGQQRTRFKVDGSVVDDGVCASGWDPSVKEPATAEGQAPGGHCWSSRTAMHVLTMRGPGEKMIVAALPQPPPTSHARATF
jgi:hypothetical protein